MVDFRSRYDPTANNQALIQAMAAKAGVQNPLSAGLQQVVPGIEKGLQLSEALGKIKEDRQRKQKLAELLSSDVGQEANSMLGGFAELLPPEKIGEIIAEINLNEQKNELDRPYRESQTALNESKLADINRMRELRQKPNRTPFETEELNMLMKQNQKNNDTLDLVNALKDWK